jgi:transglutaminase-like putative cysteine protease
VPAAYEPVRIEGLRGVGEDIATRTVIAPDELRGGTDYSVRSRLPTLSYEELDRAPRTADASLARYLLLPRTPEIVRVEEIGRAIVREAKAPDDAPFRQAVALQDYLRSFEYDEDVALNHSINDIESFLVDVRRGYCEQFATSMAVLARTLGLPSRVAIGFAVGTSGTEPDEYEVTSRHAHAWVEIWMTGYGWIPFEPTPRSDALIVPSYTTPQVTPTTPATTPTPTGGEEPSPSPTTSARDPFPEDDVTQLPGVSPARRMIQVATVLGALMVIALLALPVASRARRLLRYRRASATHDKVSARYLDFLDWCAAAGLGRRIGETPLEHAGRLAEASTDRRAMLETLARLGTDAVYAPVNGLDPSEVKRLGRKARRAMAADLPRRARLLSATGWAWWRTDPQGRERARAGSTLSDV